MENKQSSVMNAVNRVRCIGRSIDPHRFIVVVVTVKHCIVTCINHCFWSIAMETKQSTSSSIALTGVIDDLCPSWWASVPPPLFALILGYLPLKQRFELLGRYPQLGGYFKDYKIGLHYEFVFCVQADAPKDYGDGRGVIYSPQSLVRCVIDNHTAIARPLTNDLIFPCESCAMMALPDSSILITGGHRVGSLDEPRIEGQHAKIVIGTNTIDCNWDVGIELSEARDGHSSVFIGKGVSLVGGRCDGQPSSTVDTIRFVNASGYDLAHKATSSAMLCDHADALHEFVAASVTEVKDKRNGSIEHKGSIYVVDDKYQCAHRLQVDNNGLHGDAMPLPDLTNALQLNDVKEDRVLALIVVNEEVRVLTVHPYNRVIASPTRTGHITFAESFSHNLLVGPTATLKLVRVFQDLASHLLYGLFARQHTLFDKASRPWCICVASLYSDSLDIEWEFVCYDRLDNVVLPSSLASMVACCGATRLVTSTIEDDDDDEAVSMQVGA
jgi:hypothetical protein